MSHDARDDVESFDDSPRPAKRQKTTKAAPRAKQAAEQKPKKRPRGRPRKNALPPPRPDDSDSDVPIRSRAKRHSKARSLSVSSANTKSSISVAKKTPKSGSKTVRQESSDLSDDAFAPAVKMKSIPRSVKAVDSDDSEKPGKAKKPEHRSLEPVTRPVLADMYLSQMPPPQSSDPSILRGPIWVKPKPPPPEPPQVLREIKPQQKNPTRGGSYIESAKAANRASTRPAMAPPRSIENILAPLPAMLDMVSSEDWAADMDDIEDSLMQAPAVDTTRQQPCSGHSSDKASIDKMGAKKPKEIVEPSANGEKDSCGQSPSVAEQSGLAEISRHSKQGMTNGTCSQFNKKIKPVEAARWSRPATLQESSVNDQPVALSDISQHHSELEERDGAVRMQNGGVNINDPHSKASVAPKHPLNAAQIRDFWSLERRSPVKQLLGNARVREESSKTSSSTSADKKTASTADSRHNDCILSKSPIRSGPATQRLAEASLEPTLPTTRIVEPVGRTKLPPKSPILLSSTDVGAHEVIDISNELDDLPSDAFASSPERDPPPDSRSIKSAPQRSLNLSTVNGGKRQMTLHGSFSEPQDAAQSKAKKTSWPAANREEKPTHHQLNAKVTETWVYPINLGTIREYQYGIVHTGLFHNLLVALPTGLGKTFIAATIMLNWYRWTKEAQIVFVAPTKPLVAQQIDACFHTVGIPRSDTAMLTGEVSPGLREEAWATKRVFFMTPQTMANDLRSGVCDPKRLVLLVVDEAHRATGNYAYVDIVRFIRRFNSSFRVLALTATPGSKVETVQQVIDGLDISRVEIRTELSIDIRSYVYNKDIETFLFDYSPDQERVMELFSKAIKPILDKLNGFNASWSKDPMKLSAFGLNQQRAQWSKSEAGRKASFPIKGMVNSMFQVLSSLAHTITLLRFHGIGCFFRKIKIFKNEVDSGGDKRKCALQIKENENFVKMFNQVSRWTAHPDFIGHPKMEHLRQVILNHFLDAGETGRKEDKAVATRVMVFAHYRDSAEEIVQVLRRNEPMVRPHVFVGQAASEGSEGMDQKAQLAVIEKFRAGTYNTLVATSIGEEGLDIGEVDLIICFDASASPIRMLQRMGRTGRKRQGKIALLLMRDKEERDYAAAKDNYEKMQGMITDGKHFTFHEDRSSRILPRETKPTVDKRVVEIPIENSQTDLPVPSKAPRAKKKKAPKKFHMPDGVVTGFVTARRLNSDGVADEESNDDEPAPKKGKRKSLAKAKSTVTIPTPEPEAIPLPFLEDVLLNRTQEKELERKYQYVTGDDIVQAPMPEKNLAGFRYPSSTKYVSHANVSTRVAEMLGRMHEMDGISLARFEEQLHHSDLEGDDSELFAAPVRDLDKDLDEDRSIGTEVSPSRLEDAARPAVGPAMKTKGRTKQTGAPSKAKAKRRASKKGVSPSSKARYSDAIEGDASSPPPTPADMRLPSQGIDLGTVDTSGEDVAEGDWSDDSEMRAFVAKSDESIEFESSSLPMASSRGRVAGPIFTSDAEDDDIEEVHGYDPGADEDISRLAAGGAVARKRKWVVESDSDD